MSETPIFVSKSGASDPYFVKELQMSLYENMVLYHEDIFRYPDSMLHAHPFYNDSPLVAAHFHWCEQLEWSRQAKVFVVLFTGEERDRSGQANISEGMNIEVFDGIWRGVPVIWCGTTHLGMAIATRWHKMMSKRHPCMVSHIYDGRLYKEGGLDKLVSLCFTLSNKPIPMLPVHFSIGEKRHLEYHVCKPDETGWEFADLKSCPHEPSLWVEYGEHIITSPYWKPKPCPRYTLKIPMTIKNAYEGIIKGSIELPRSGFGQMKLRWVDKVGYLVADEVWGGQLLHWDFVCDYDHPSF